MEEISLTNLPENAEAGITTALNMAVHYWLTFGHAQPERIKEIANAIAPFGSAESKTRFDRYYLQGNYMTVYDLQLDYGSGYHTLASLYAASGDVPALLNCFQKLGVDRSYFAATYS